jgi:hypothetical protein
MNPNLGTSASAPVLSIAHSTAHRPTIDEIFDLNRPFINPSLAFRTAQQIANLGDRQSLIFRRFDKLAIQNILDLHGRLAALDKREIFLDIPGIDDVRSPPPAELRRLLEEYRTL